MPQNHRFSLLIHISLLLIYGIELFGLSQLNSQCFSSSEANLAFSTFGLIGIGILGLVIAILTLIQRMAYSIPHTAQSEARLRSILEGMPVMLDALDANGNIIVWNQECERVTGYKASEVIGNASIMEQLYPNAQYWQQQLAEWKRLGDSYRNWEWELTTKDGSIRTIAWSNIAAECPVPGWATWGIGVDITERKKTERELAQANERFRLAMSAINAAVYDWNIEHDRVDRSEGMSNLFGFPSEAIDSNSGWWMSRIHPDDIEVARQSFQEALQHNERYSLEYRIQNQQGEYVYVHDQGLILRDATGRAVRVVGSATDISDRKQAETALKQSEAIARARASELEAFMEAVPAGVWIAHDPHCHNVTPNRAAYEMMRRPPNAIMTATPPDGRYPFQFKIQQNGQDVDLNNLPMQQAGRTGEPAAGEFEFVFEDGDICFLYGKAVPVRYESGDIRGVIGAFIDITHLKRAEAALSQANERFELAAMAVDCLIYDWRVETNQVERTEGLTRLLGYSLAEAEPSLEWWRQQIHPEDYANFCNTLDATTGMKSRCAIEYRVRHQQGHYIYVQDHCIVLRDESGRLVRIVGSATDVTERKQTEAALQESELMFRTLADTMPQLFWVIQPDGYQEYCNQRWYDYTGLPPEKTQSERAYQIVHPDDVSQTITTFEEALKAGTMFTAENRLRRASDGAYRWHLSQALPLRQNGQIVKWFGSSTDIHDQKVLIEERAQALERERAARMELERASRMKDEFLAVVSHELRSPLNAILGWSRLLRTRSFDPEKTEQALASIERNAQAQTQLIEDLLDISRIIRGKIRLDLRPTNLVPCVQAAIDTIRPTATTKLISIALYSVLDVVFVSGDAERLQQIVWNLLSNAVKFTPTGGRIEVRIHPFHRTAQIQVIDSGKGISPDFLPYVFERFRQEDATTTRTHGGLGLGLAIVRNLVELHGGSIHVDSAGEGEGATFTVELPLLPTVFPEHSANHQGLHRQTIADTSLDLSNVHILVVDDERDTREFLQVALEQYGARVTCAESAAEAWQFLQGQQPDVLLSDVGMPDEDGLTLIRRIRSRPASQGGNIPAAALTAYAREGDRLEALAAGFQIHLPKPIEPIQLLTVITRLLERQRELSN